jgi:S1-C subfamily serine protease
VDAKVGGTPVREYILLRYGALMQGNAVTIKPARLENELSAFHAVTSGFGSAVPIDRRGYFLTAAHCLGEGPMQLVYFGRRSLTTEPVRVVWRGDRGPDPLDIAIVCVPSALSHIFEWATDFEAQESVLAAGPNYTHSKEGELLSIVIECFAGRMTSFSAQKGVEPLRTRISHDAPVHFGDSGGPLLTRDGRLLGINTQAWTVAGRFVRLPFLPRGYTYRPDPRWIKLLIEEDFARQSNRRRASRTMALQPPASATLSSQSVLAGKNP